MPVIAVSGIPMKFSLSTAQKVIEKSVRTKFKVLQFKETKPGHTFKVMYIRLYNDSDPAEVIRNIQNSTFGRIQLTAFMSKNQPKVKEMIQKKPIKGTNEKPEKFNLKPNSNRPSTAQLEALLKFLEENKHIAKGLLRGTRHIKEENKRKWAEVADIINQHGDVVKDGPGWSKYWAEKKCVLRRLYGKHVEAQSIGDATNCLTRLSELDMRFIAVTAGARTNSDTAKVYIDSFPPQAMTRRDFEAAPKMEVLNDVDLNNEDSLSPTFNFESQRSPTHIGSETNQTHTGWVATDGSEASHPTEVNFDRLQRIEERHVEAKLLSAQALNNVALSLDRCAASLTSGARLIADALLEIARKMPGP